MDGSAGGDLMTVAARPDPRDRRAPRAAAAELRAAAVGTAPAPATRCPRPIGRIVRVPGAIVQTVVPAWPGRPRTSPPSPGRSSPSPPHSPLNGPLTSSRTVAFRRCSLADLSLVHHELGATINDVVLAATTMAMRGYLHARDETPEEPLVASVPVDRRKEGEEFGNHTSNILVKLPVDLDDPAAIVHSIHETTIAAKAAGAGARQYHLSTRGSASCPPPCSPPAPRSTPASASGSTTRRCSTPSCRTCPGRRCRSTWPAPASWRSIRWAR